MERHANAIFEITAYSLRFLYVAAHDNCDEEGGKGQLTFPQ